MTSPTTRTEHDSLGPLEVPAHAYYGVHTQRAVNNFPLTGKTIGSIPQLVTALAQVKIAAAQANQELGAIPAEVGEPIIAAAGEIADGALHSEFVVDVIQGGAGTSTNMNINEVVANRALEILGKPRGDYTTINPLDHVNRGQSTNDVYPTALRIALFRAIDPLLSQLRALSQDLRAKAEE